MTETAPAHPTAAPVETRPRRRRTPGKDESGDPRKPTIGRPQKVGLFRPFVVELLAKEPDIRSLEIVRRARLAGYEGGRSALYALIAAVRPLVSRQ